MTFEGSEHGLQVGVADRGGGGLQCEGFLKPVSQSSWNLHIQTCHPKRHHRHSMHQCPLMYYHTQTQNQQNIHNHVIIHASLLLRTSGGNVAHLLAAEMG